MRTVTVLAPPAPVTVSAAWLEQRLGAVDVVDTRAVDEYLDGHVPSARVFPLGGLLVEDTSVPALEALAAAARAALGQRGIDGSRPVVLVDGNDGSASTGVFICELAGLRDVKVLHGGVAAWLQHGGSLDVAPPQVAPVVLDATTRTETIAGIDDLRLAETAGVSVVDVRSQLEHEGIVGSPCCASRGNIPGSLHLEWTALLSAFGDLHPPERIRQEAEHVGLQLDDPIIVYCHSGQRSAVAGIALRSAGFTNVRNALGSWHEWSSRGLHAEA